MSFQAWHDPTWYSDTDVRNSPELQEMALEYLAKYEGEFEPLLVAQVWLSEADEDAVMPTDMLRKVVNTMRHDNEVNHRMPIPIRFGDVQKTSSGIQIEPCASTGPHYGPHTWFKGPVRAGGGRHRQVRSCPGVAWPINRPDRITTKVSLDQKYQFVRARSGRMLHKVADFDPAYAWWWPQTHDWGFRTPAVLRVRTACKNPSVINDPVLLTARQKANMMRRKEDPVPLCQYCAEA